MYFVRKQRPLRHIINTNIEDVLRYNPPGHTIRHLFRLLHVSPIHSWEISTEFTIQASRKATTLSRPSTMAITTIIFCSRCLPALYLLAFRRNTLHYTCYNKPSLVSLPLFIHNHRNLDITGTTTIISICIFLFIAPVKMQQNQSSTTLKILSHIYMLY